MYSPLYESCDALRNKLERKLADYFGVKYVVTCSSGRTALRYGLLALGIKSSDEVIIQDFVGDIVPLVVWCVGGRPKFCDVEKKSLALSSTDILKKITDKTKAIILIHLYGIPVNPKPILEIAEDKDLKVIDDAAQSLGAEVNGVKTGTFGDCGIVSFGKFLNTDFGAALITKDVNLARKVMYLRTIHERRSSLLLRLCYKAIRLLGGKNSPKSLLNIAFKSEYFRTRILYQFKELISGKKWQLNSEGRLIISPSILQRWNSHNLTSSQIDEILTYEYNYHHNRRLEDVEIERIYFEFDLIKNYLLNRRKIVIMYNEFFSQKNVEVLQTPESCKSAYFKYPIIFKNERAKIKVWRALVNAGFKIDYWYQPLHTSPLWSKFDVGGRYYNSEYFASRLLPLPIENNFRLETVRKIKSVFQRSYMC